MAGESRIISPDWLSKRAKEITPEKEKEILEKNEALKNMSYEERRRLQEEKEFDEEWFKPDHEVSERERNFRRLLRDAVDETCQVSDEKMAEQFDIIMKSLNNEDMTEGKLPKVSLDEQMQSADIRRGCKGSNGVNNQRSTATKKLDYDREGH